MKETLFVGKINRKQFWLRFLVVALIGGVLNSIPIVLEAFNETVEGVENQDFVNTDSAMYSIAPLLIVLGFIIVSIQRLHDLGRSGWWSLCWLIPLLGPIAMLIYCGFFPAKEKQSDEMVSGGKTA